MRAIPVRIIAGLAVLFIPTSAFPAWYCQAEGKPSKLSLDDSAVGTAVAPDIDSAKARALAECSAFAASLYSRTRACVITACEPRDPSLSSFASYWWDCHAEGAPLTSDDDVATGNALLPNLANSKAHALADCSEYAAKSARHTSACVIRSCVRREASK
jgi:hypothetical protein